LAGRITDLAAAHDAEVTLAQVISALDVPDDIARTTLADMEAKGLCHRELRDGRAVYVFPGLKESKVVRRCSYCGSEYSVREPLHKCTNCGGPLEIVKT
jgi:rRNA maturation endonuclease Nob1